MEALNTTLDIASGTQSLTISVWFKQSGTATGNLFGNGTKIVFTTTSNDELQLILNDFNPNDRITTSNSPIIAGTWQHLLGRYTSGGDIEVWVDGVLKGSVTPGGSYASDAGHWDIGSHVTASSSSPIAGEITDVAVWFSALTDSEIKLLAQSRVKGMPLQIQGASLQAYYPLDDLPNGHVGVNTDFFIDRTGNRNLADGKDGDEDTVAIGEAILSYP